MIQPFRPIRLVPKNLATHRRSNLLSRSRGISMTTTPGSWPSPRPARSQCAECFKGPRQNARWHSDEAAPLEGVGGSEAASSKARAVLCSGEPLQHGARHEIKDFHGTLLSSWPPQLGQLENGFGFSERRQAGTVSSWIPVASRSITPGCLQLLGYEKRFQTAWTHSGHGGKRRDWTHRGHRSA